MGLMNSGSKNMWTNTLSLSGSTSTRFWLKFQRMTIYRIWDLTHTPTSITMFNISTTSICHPRFPQRTATRQDMRFSNWMIWVINRKISKLIFWISYQLTTQQELSQFPTWNSSITVKNMRLRIWKLRK